MARPTRDAFRIGWICALPIEAAAATDMLDENFGILEEQDAADSNIYTMGRIGSHYVVIVCLPHGQYGTTSATTVTNNMLHTFNSLRIGLMVGIGGGIPSAAHDIRLGDVVISCPQDTCADKVNNTDGESEQTGSLNSLPSSLSTAVSTMRTASLMDNPHYLEYLQNAIGRTARTRKRFGRPIANSDRLFQAIHDHSATSSSCDGCLSEWEEIRDEREDNKPQTHYGIIASGNKIIKHGRTREQLRLETGALCYEMEAAGLILDIPCLLIRGVSDYTDSHKNKEWQGYAAMAAAALTKELLGYIRLNTQDRCDRLVQNDLAEMHLSTNSEESERSPHKHSDQESSTWATGVSQAMSWLRKSATPRLKSEYRRIEWKCDCGVDLYADFPDRDKDHLDRLAFSLQNPAQASINGHPDISTGLSDTLNHNESVGTQLPSNGEIESLGSSPGTIRDTVACPNDNFQCDETRYLAICVNTGTIYKTLAEIETSNIKSDAVAFSILKDKYLKTRGIRSQFSFLIKPNNIEFIQFTLWNLRGGYISVCDRPNCIPPDNCHEYEFSRPQTPLPPMPPEIFIHYLEHEERDLNPLRNDWLPRLPKRKGKRVIDCNEACIGWGIHVIEGPNREVIFWILMITIMASVVVGVLWSTLRHDVQAGTGIGALIVALPSAIMTAFLFRFGAV